MKLSELWSWSMRTILIAAFGGRRGLIMYLNLVLRWRRWKHRNDAVKSHWNITHEKFRDIDRQEFETALADSLARRVTGDPQ